MNKKKLKIHGVYAITNNYAFAKKLIMAKAKIIQYRDKNIDDENFIKTAEKIKKLCRKNNVLFVINDRYRLNKKIKADCIHLGLHDGQTKNIFGQSVKTITQAKSAEKKGALYIAVSPVFDTINKKEEKGLGLKRLREIKKAVKIPVCAIGGITEKNLPQVIKAGADCAAFIGELVHAKNLRKKINNLCRIMYSKK